MSTSFVVLFQGRTGSTFLIEALASHPNVVARGEVLLALGSSARVQIEWTRQYFSIDRPSGCAAVGFKTKLADVIDPASFASLLRDAECRILHLDRANVVKQAISWMRADLLFERTAGWNVYDRTQKVPPTSLAVDGFITRLRAIQDGRSNLEQYVHALGTPICTVSYEQLLIDPQTEFRRILQFLDVAGRPLQSSCMKNTDDDLHAIVPNLAELRSPLVGTSYESMFDEVLVSN
jgi:LPS sulfotransferase NodH